MIWLCSPSGAGTRQGGGFFSTAEKENIPSSLLLSNLCSVQSLANNLPIQLQELPKSESGTLSNGSGLFNNWNNSLFYPWRRVANSASYHCSGRMFSQHATSAFHQFPASLRHPNVSEPSYLMLIQYSIYWPFHLVPVAQDRNGPLQHCISGSALIH